MSKETINLLEDVLFEIRDSLIDGDAEALKDMLQHVPIQFLINYLPEEVADKYRAVNKSRNEGSKDV